MILFRLDWWDVFTISKEQALDEFEEKFWAVI